MTIRIRSRKRNVCLAALFLLVASRVGAQDFDGEWSGSAATRTFSVVNDRIVQFSFQARVSTGFCTSTVTISGTASVPIANNSFSFVPSAGGTTFIISGTFQSFTSVGGLLVILGTPCSVLSLTTWSATKVGDDTISVFMGDGQVVEGDFGFSTGELEVTLDKAPTQPVSVDYRTRGGTAEGDVDFVSGSGTLRFAPGETSKHVPVEAIGDSRAEFPESFFVDLSGATHAKVFDATGFGLIVDPDEEEQPAALGFVEAHVDGAAGVDGLDGAESVAVSPDGRHVYVASGVDDAVAVFERDAATGTLSFVESTADGSGDVDGLNGASSVAVSPDGGHVYVTGDLDDAVAAFERDAASGALRFVGARTDGEGGVDGIESASSVAVSPDGRHVYVTGEFDDAVAAFERNPASGALRFVAARTDGEGGVDGIEGASSVAVAPDGRHVYVTGEFDDAVATFERNPASGALRFLGALFDGAGGVDGLGGASAVAVAPDGSQVFVTGGSDDALAVFDRDGSTGALRFREVFHDDLGGLDEPRSVTLSPGGRHVFVGGSASRAIAVFDRDPGTGNLSYLGAQFDGAGPVDGLDAVESVAVSPDGDHVYAAAMTDDAVAVFTTAEVVADPPEAHFTWSPPSPVEGEEVRFTDASTGRPTSWSWSFGDGATSAQRNPSHTYAEAGTYTVTLTVANGAGSDSMSADVAVGSASSCVSGPSAMCLNGRRFRVEVDWRDFAGKTGSAQVVPFGSDDSGLLWFFDADNWEMLVKVLDGCRITDHFWVFAAATTNVEYTLRVTDTLTGDVMSYFNPLGNAAAAITDTEAFATCQAASSAATTRARSVVREEVPTGPRIVPAPTWTEAAKQGGCSPGTSHLCLSRRRFEVEVEWRDFQGGTGVGRVVPFGSDDSGLFWFFNADNWEMLVKVLDGCSFNERFWVFAAATTNVEYTLRVTDTETGVVKEYLNPLGASSAAITDTGAFSTCP